MSKPKTKTLCDTENCQSPAVHEVRVSEKAFNDAPRHYCESCHSAYLTGKQHVSMFFESVCKRAIGTLRPGGFKNMRMASVATMLEAALRKNS